MSKRKVHPPVESVEPADPPRGGTAMVEYGLIISVITAVTVATVAVPLAVAAALYKRLRGRSPD